jgi:hypothetical protein
MHIIDLPTSRRTAKKKLERTSGKSNAHRHIFIFKCLNNHINFDFGLVYNSSIYNYNTRQSCFLHLPKTRTNWGKHKVNYRAVYDYNNLELDCQNTQSIFQFKSKVFGCRPRCTIVLLDFCQAYFSSLPGVDIHSE